MRIAIAFAVVSAVLTVAAAPVQAIVPIEGRVAVPSGASSGAGGSLVLRTGIPDSAWLPSQDSLPAAPMPTVPVESSPSSSDAVPAPAATPVAEPAPTAEPQQRTPEEPAPSGGMAILLLGVTVGGGLLLMRRLRALFDY